MDFRGSGIPPAVLGEPGPYGDTAPAKAFLPA